MINSLKIFGRAGWDLLFPPSCLGCRASLSSSQIPLFCQECFGRLTWLNSPLCTSCGRPLNAFEGHPSDHFCGLCLQKPPHFTQARAALIYEGPITKAIQAYKYNHDLAGVASFAALARHSPALNWPELDYILPVPLHLKKLRDRGFNQALVLARAFFPFAAEKILADLLLRHRWTDPQTGMSGSQRRENLRDAFKVACSQKIKNRRILLVDDVFTTGSTVNECARVLKVAGAAELRVFTLARVRE